MYDIQTLIFYQFAFILLVSATAVVISKNPVKSVLSLVLAFVASAFLWMLQQAEFLALALVFVYIGAVMTLFLFIVLMINANTVPPRQRIWSFFPLVLALAGIFSYAFYRAFSSSVSTSNVVKYSGETMLGSAENIASVLYTKYLIPFELVSILLLVAIVAAISLSFRGAQHGALKQRIGRQVMADPKKRVIMVKMEAESK